MSAIPRHSFRINRSAALRGSTSAEACHCRSRCISVASAGCSSSATRSIGSSARTSTSTGMDCASILGASVDTFWSTPSGAVRRAHPHPTPSSTPAPRTTTRPAPAFIRRPCARPQPAGGEEQIQLVLSHRSRRRDVGKLPRAYESDRDNPTPSRAARAPRGRAHRDRRRALALAGRPVPSGRVYLRELLPLRVSFVRASYREFRESPALPRPRRPMFTGMTTT